MDIKQGTWGAAARNLGSRALDRAASGTRLPAGCVLASCVLLGCEGTPDRWDPQPSNPLVLLCVDGLEPTIVSAMIEQGRLPAMASFAERGVLGSIETLIPTWSPVIWTTIATGRSKEAHGVEFFLEETHTNLPYTSNARKVPALWNLVSDAGLTVDLVGYWVTWPAEEINGRVLASYAAQAQANVIWKPGLWENLDHQTWPPELAQELEPLITFLKDDGEAVDAFLEEFSKPQHGNDLIGTLYRDLAWTRTGDRSFANVARHFLENDPADLSIVYLSLPDVAGHRFWRYHQPSDMDYPVDESEVRAYGDMIRRCYEVTDAELGSLLERIPENANVVLISDHGMHADSSTKGDPKAITSGHHQAGPSGVFGAFGPAFAQTGSLYTKQDRRGRIGEVRCIAPLALHLLGLPVPEDWPIARFGNALDDLLDPAWLKANPGRLRTSPDLLWLDEWPRSLPMAPGGDLNLGFQQAMEELGYF